MTSLTYFEPLTAGHCSFWARMVLQAAAADPRISRLRFVTGREMADRLSDVVDATGLELEVLPEAQIDALSQDGLMARGRAQWAAARACLEGVGGQLFLPFFDHAVFGAAVDRRPMKGQVSGILFRPPNGYNLPTTPRRRVDVSRRWGTYLAAKRPAVRRLFTLDEVAPQSAVSRMSKLLTFLPDPAPDLSLLEGRERRPRSDGRKVHLLFGSLGSRKGIFVVLDALAHVSADVRATLALRFVGRALAQDREAFTAALERARAAYPEMAIEWVDDFVSDEELAQEVSDSDVVLAPYQNHLGSSGVVFWATAAGKPLIAQRTGLMGYQIDRYDLGLAADTTDPAALARAMEAVEMRPRNTEFLGAHSVPAFTGTILGELLS
ncbi:Glycosyl transferases group 1 [Salipiger thiooxidans]|uniref:Glycosyl transferases group 1 n=1 Tax=Salipiger thiooxidans TaxID=282683 RepID=A0A1G7LLN9_9RHOB|nr:glycosyltransferase [Salipiger thiooxidans]SDF50296.1 Glycosyl transferases group 1 [Salipiger thiooxidans]